MRRRLVLLATAATTAIATAWTVVASAAFLWFANLWDHPYFAHGLRWTWAWFAYVSKPAMRATYGNTLNYTGLAAAALVGMVAFRVCEIFVNLTRSSH